MTLTSLPTEYTFGKVVARIIQAVADGSDEDRYPDMIAATGTVTFKPKQRQRKTADYRALVLNQPIRCRLYNPENWEDPAHPPGTLIDPQGNLGVWLTVGSYDVEFQLNQGGFPPMEITVMEEHTKKNPLDLIEYAPPHQPGDVIMVTAVIPPGGAPNQTLVRGKNGQLAWRDFLDEEFRSEFISYRDQAKEAFEKFTWPVQVQDTPPENTDVIWVNPDEPAGTASDYARRAEEMYEATKALGITVDTSVGTRVFAGDTMIHGRLRTRIFYPDGDRGGDIRIARENHVVTVTALNISQDSEGVIFEVPLGLRPRTVQYGNSYWGNRSYITVNGVFYLSYAGTGGDSISYTYITDDDWPDSW